MATKITVSNDTPVVEGIDTSDQLIEVTIDAKLQKTLAAGQSGSFAVDKGKNVEVRLKATT